MPSMAKLEKAYLDIREPNRGSSGQAGSRDQRTPGAVLRQIGFQFNPEELTITKAAGDPPTAAATQPGAASAPVPQYVGAKPASMSLAIFLDAGSSRTGDIMGDVEALMETVAPTRKSRSDQAAHQPLVVFGWGSKINFTAIVKNVSAKYDMFKQNGTPIRATVSLTLEEYPLDTPRQNPSSGGTATHRTRTIRAGDTLASVAFDEYGDAAKWRGLAALNGIEDPLRTPPGTTLLVPPDDVVDEYS